MATAVKVPTIFTAVDKMSAVVSKMTGGVKKFAKSGAASVDRLNSKLNRSFNRMGRLSQLGLGIGLAGMFNMAIQGNLEYNESLASLQAITGATGQQTEILEDRVMGLAKKSGKSGSEIAKAFELVGSSKPELLKNVDALEQTTDSVITLAKASKMDLASSADSLTSVMNQFDLSADQSRRTINAMAAGAKEGAAAIPLISEAILQFGTGAAASNVSMEESIALVETFASKGIKGAESGTKLRNILTKMSAIDALPKSAIDQLEKFGVNTDKVSNSALPFNERLRELSKIAGDSTALVKVFGLENKEAGKILLDNIGKYENLTKAITGTSEAERQAAVNGGTLNEMILKVKNSFTNTTTATNSNSVALAVVTGMLSLVADNMHIVIGFMATLLLGFLALKIAAGIIKGIEIATKLWTGAQKVLNTVMKANPIGIVITAVMILVGIISVIIAKYDSWGAAVSMLLGPLGFVVSLVMSFKRHWESIKKAFSEGGISAGIERIGQVILDALLMPMQQFLEMVSSIPGVGKFADPALKAIENIRANLNLSDTESTTNDSPGESNGFENNSNSPAFIPSTQQTNSEIIKEKFMNGNISLNVNDPGSIIQQIQTSGDYNMPVLSTTQGQR